MTLTKSRHDGGAASPNGADGPAGPGPEVDEPPSPAKRLARYGLWAVAVLAFWTVAAWLLPRGLPTGIVVLGLVFGSLYALLAIGIVLVYRSSRVINFAQAEFGAVAAVLAIQLVFQYRWNYFLAIATGLTLAALSGALVQVLVIRRFRRAPRLIVSVATIGIAQILNGLAILIPILFEGGMGARRFTTPFEANVQIHPVVLNGNHLLAMLVAPVAMVVLAAFLRFSDYGVAVRAAADNGDRAYLMGVPVPRLATIVWSMAALLSAMAVILRVPIVGFASFVSVSGSGNALLLRTLAAAVLGRMESLPRTVTAALALGVFQEAASWTLSNTDIVDALLVVVILGALLLQRDFFRRVQETGISTWRTIREVRSIPNELRGLPEVRYTFGAIRAGLVLLAVTLPVWAGPSRQEAASLVLIYAMVAVSLLVLTGWTGHISLGQFALVGFGAAGTAFLYGRLETDYFVAVLGGVFLAAAVSLVVGLPALRIRGPFLAVTTLAFAVTASSFFLEDRYFPWFIVETIERPRLWQRISLEQDWQVYYLALAGLLLVMMAARNVRRTRLGRAFIAVRDNEHAAETVTLNATRVKLIAFVLSGAMAGLAGSIYVVHQRGVTSGSYASGLSIQLFSMVVIGGLGSLPGAVLGAVFVRGAQSMLPRAWALIASGGGILVLLMFLPEGLGGLVYSLRDGFLRRVASRRQIVVPSLGGASPAEAGPESVPAARLGVLAAGDGAQARAAPRDQGAALQKART